MMIPAEDATPRLYGPPGRRRRARISQGLSGRHYDYDIWRCHLLMRRLLAQPRQELSLVARF